ncbi:MAG TPA: cupin domain-containing protein [Rhizomicrobium sp.]|nr:cupin domain-containing protein [Rhizomicrobium sp.]
MNVPGQADSNCEWSEATCAYAVHALTGDEVAAAVAHNIACVTCRRELESLRPVIDSFISWPVDILRPRASLQTRLARRIADETGELFAWPDVPQWPEPQWEPVAPGIECKLLAGDTERKRVSMLVRFAAGASFTAHTHAESEECHLLDGDLRIDEDELLPGDCKYGAPGSRHTLVHSRMGCTCLVVTSTGDGLG